ncbi:MAG: hypothetical protein IKN81_11245 [Oscillospiraceae bacterium]|nr:hypothetical protein [Oscillospiraceae bacterium]
MPNLEELKRMAQNAAYAATELAQGAAAAAGEKAGAIREYAGEKASSLKGYAEEKAALLSEKRSLARNCQALGEWYVAQCGDNPPEAVADVVKSIRASQEKIAALRATGAEDTEEE